MLRVFVFALAISGLFLASDEPDGTGAGGADLQADANCSGEVDTVDALAILRHSAGLSAAACEHLADVQCDGDVDTIDALQVLRWGAALSVSQQPGCPPIGEATGPPPTSSDLIAEALAAGDIDEETALVYEFYAAFNDPRLPAEYEGDDSGVPELQLWSKVGAMWETLPQATRDLLLPFMRTPAEPGSWYTPSTSRVSGAGIEWMTVSSKAHPVKIWWETRFPADEARAELLADAIDSDIWPQLTQLMGTDPKPDCGAGCPSGGGDPSLDVYLIGEGPDANYTTVPANTPLCERSSAFIVLLPSASPSTLAHEFMHVLQFALPYANGGCPDAWWWEATANWAEDFVWKSQYQEEQPFAPDFLTTTHRPLENAAGDREYGAYLFPFYLDRVRGNPQLVPDIFARLATESNSLRAIESEVSGALGAFDEVWKDFTLKNWNREHVSDYKDLDGLTDGATQISQEVRIGEIEIDEAEVEHLGAVYMKFTFNSNVHKVVFSNTLAGVDHAGVMAIKQVDGEWKDPEDWSDEGEKEFCLDRPSEKLTELILIFSNSDALGKAKLAPENLPTIEGKPDSCSGFEGTVTAQGVDGYGVVVSATATGVRFEPQKGFSNLGLVAGTATWTASGSDSFGCSVSGVAHYDFSDPTEDIQGAGLGIDSLTGAYYVEIVLNTGGRMKQHAGCPPPYDHLNGDQIWVNSTSLIPFQNNTDYMLKDEGDVRVAQDSLSMTDFHGFENVTYSWRFVEYGTSE